MPGYTSACPVGYELALDAWVTGGWIATAAISAEAVLLALNLLIFRLRRTAPDRSRLALLIVVGCAASAVALTLWIGRFNAETCLYTSIHLNPAWLAYARRTVNAARMKADVVLGAIAALFALATFLMVVTFIRGWRMSRRRGAPASI